MRASAEILKNIIMSEILKQYKVKFSNPKDSFMKDISTINETMSAFIWDHYTHSTVNSLLSFINDKINSNSSVFEEVYTQGEALALINKTTTKIYIDMNAYGQSNNITPDYTLPTADFKVIVEAWRDYLQQN